MAKANKLIPVVDGTAGTPIELTDSRIEITNPAANDLLQYDSTQQQFVNTPASSVVPSHRTINHEQITDSSLGDINLHDGFYFPNAVQDYDGNWYGAVVIGDKVWLGSNLRTKHLADGTAINSGGQSGSALNYYDYATHPLPVEKRGLLYSFPVAASTIIINWETPTSDDFIALNAYLNNQTRYSSAVKAMAATDGWGTSSVNNAIGNDLLLNNGSGLSLYPTGKYNSSASAAGDCVLWTTNGTSTKTCPYLMSDDITYGTRSYNYSSWSLAIRLISTLTPVQFRDWYVKTYGTLQHKLDELPSISGNSGKVLAVNGTETDVEWVTQSGGGGGGASQLNDLSDVTISSAASGQALLHNGTNWVNGALPQEVFLCTLTSNNGTYSMDKTPEEIYQAVVASKKIAICKFNAQIFYCYYAWYDNNSYTIKFSQIQVNGTTEHLVAYIWNTGNTWYYKSGNLQSQLVDSGANQNIKTINGNSLLGSGDLTIGGGTEELLMCTFTGSTTVTCDKTIVQIYDAYQNEKCIIGIRGSELYNLSYCTSTIATFYSINSPNTNNPVLYAISTSDSGATWTKTEFGIQKQLVSGTNIRTINNISLLAAGNLTIPAPTINTRYNPYSISADGSTSFGLNGNREYSRMQFADGVTTYGFTFTVSDENKNYDRFVLLDNTNNTKDVTITINSVQIATNNVYSDCDNIFKPRPLVVKAGSFVELTVKILKSDVGATTGIVTLNNNISRYVTIYSGSTAPSSSTGSDGDIYIQTVS